jgi:hypothetical protein
MMDHLEYKIRDLLKLSISELPETSNLSSVLIRKLVKACKQWSIWTLESRRAIYDSTIGVHQGSDFLVNLSADGKKALQVSIDTDFLAKAVKIDQEDVFVTKQDSAAKDVEQDHVSKFTGEVKQTEHSAISQRIVCRQTESIRNYSPSCGVCALWSVDCWPM